MTYALFWGCKIPEYIGIYERAVRAVLKSFGIKTVDINGFNCCGYPLKNTDFKAFLLSSVRNLAIAEMADYDLMVFCDCCYGALRSAQKIMKDNETVRAEINAILASEGLKYGAKVKVYHFLNIIETDIGIEKLKSAIRTRPYAAQKIAAHYGCHQIRPSDVTGGTHPGANWGILESIINACGAENIDWPKNNHCCGASLLGINDLLSGALAMEKIKNAICSDANAICVSCPYCYLQFTRWIKTMESHCVMRVILAPELLWESLNRSKNKQS